MRVSDLLTRAAPFGFSVEATRLSVGCDMVSPVELRGLFLIIIIIVIVLSLALLRLCPSDQQPTLVKRIVNVC